MKCCTQQGKKVRPRMGQNGDSKAARMADGDLGGLCLGLGLPRGTRWPSTGPRGPKQPLLGPMGYGMFGQPPPGGAQAPPPAAVRTWYKANVWASRRYLGMPPGTSPVDRGRGPGCTKDWQVWGNADKHHMLRHAFINGHGRWMAWNAEPRSLLLFTEASIYVGVQ